MLRVGVTYHAVDKYKQLFISDRNRGRRSSYEINGIFVRGITQTRDFKFLDQLVEIGVKPEFFRLEFKVRADGGVYLGDITAVLAKGRGRRYEIRTVYPS